MAGRNRAKRMIEPNQIIMGKSNNQNVSGKHMVEQKLDTKQATTPLNLCGVPQLNVQGLADTIAASNNRNIILLFASVK